MNWWVWLLIALGIALVVGLVIFLVIRTSSKPAESVTIATTVQPRWNQQTASTLSSIEKLPDALLPNQLQNGYQRY